jgi:solute carrier family 25 (mitochondrial phosphate transporter), member 23/24/25/41
MLNDDTLHSIGTTIKSLMLALFGSIVRIASPLDQDRSQSSSPPQPAQTADSSPTTENSPPLRSSQQETHSSQNNSSSASMEATGHEQYASTARATASALRTTATSGTTAPAAQSSATTTARGTDIEPDLSEEEETAEENWLIKYLPDSGYFVAGAVAGGISRTATAPLDRLKVYLLVNTKSTSHAAIDAAKNGKPIAAITNAARSFWGATLDLYRNGGLRGFFAGMRFSPTQVCLSRPIFELTCHVGNGLNVIKIMPETAMRVSFVADFRRDNQVLMIASLEPTKPPSGPSHNSKVMATPNTSILIVNLPPEVWPA